MSITKMMKVNLVDGQPQSSGDRLQFHLSEGAVSTTESTASRKRGTYWKLRENASISFKLSLPSFQSVKLTIKMPQRIGLNKFQFEINGKSFGDSQYFSGYKDQSEGSYDISESVKVGENIIKLNTESNFSLDEIAVEYTMNYLIGETGADGTIWYYPNIIRPDDRSTFKTISAEPIIAKVNMIDLAVNWDVIDVEAYKFEVLFDDNIRTNVNVRKVDYTQAEAAVLAKEYATSMGRLPAFLRQGIDNINLLKGEGRNWTGAYQTKSLNLQVGGYLEEKFKSQKILEETLMHEACHATIDGKYYGTEDGKKAWKEAQTQDNMFISLYASQNPDREDVAESIVPYLAVKYRNNRVSEDDYKKMAQAIPNRIKVLDQANMNFYPILASDNLDTTYWYRLTNCELGNNWSVDNDKKTVFMSETVSNRYGQYWKLTPYNNGIRLSSRFSDEGYAIDTGPNKQDLQFENYFKTGTQWHLIPLENGEFRLTNNWSGEDYSLGLQDKKVLMVNRNDTAQGQRWKLTQVTKI